MQLANPAVPGSIKLSGALIFIGLVVSGMLGDYFRFTVFHSVDFAFGSIFALLALQIFGVRAGVAAALLIGGATYAIRHDPYLVAIASAEMAAVAWLATRRKIGLVLADAIYWVVVGAPACVIFYYFIIKAPDANANVDIMMTICKQAINGVANALIARLLFTGYALKSRSSTISYREWAYNLLVFSVLFPMLILLAIDGRKDFAATDKMARASLTQDSRRMSAALEHWLENKEAAIVTLAELATTLNTAQMQSRLEQALKSDSDFSRIGLLDKDAVSTAVFPPVDEFGVSNIGKSFADRPYLPALRNSTKPMLSEVFESRFGRPDSIAIVLAPVRQDGVFNGYTAGILSFPRIHALLEKNSGNADILFSLLDKKGHVIVSNRQDRHAMPAFARPPGASTSSEQGIALWTPAAAPETPQADHWRRSFYVAELPLGKLAESEWTLIVEQPARGFQNALSSRYTEKLLSIFALLLLVLAIAETMSRWVEAAIDEFGQSALKLLSESSSGQASPWPKSVILEANALSGDFRAVANSLTEQFAVKRHINKALEQQVEERTRELREQAELLGYFYELPFIGMAITSPTTKRWLQFNDRLCEIFGYPRAELLEKTWAELTHPDDVDQDVAEFERVLRGEIQGYSMEKRFIRRDGALVYASIDVRCARNADGAVKFFLAMVQDITAGKRSEQVLRESEARFRQMFENNASVLLLIEPESGLIVDANLSAARFYGYSSDELKSMKISQINDLPAEEVAAERARAAQQQRNYFVFPHRLANGDIRIVEVRSTPIAVEGRVLLFSIIHDITEQKLAETALIQYQQHLEDMVSERTTELARALDASEAANRAKSAFLVNMSHEFRTPMTGILGLTSMLIRSTAEPKQLERLSKLDSAAHQLLNILNDILEMTNIEAGAVALERREFDPQGILHKVKAAIGHRAALKGLSLELACDPALPPRLIGDPLRLKQALINLADNAVKFTRTGSVKLDVQIESATPAKVAVRFAVSDTGVGIAPEQLELIFRAFEQADNSKSREFGGVGLGLTISRHFVELMGSRIEVDSQANRGSRFSFVVDFEIGRAIDEPPAPIAPTKPANELRLLLAEDDMLNREILSGLLAQEGYKVDLAESGEHAVELASRNDYDIILMELHMPTHMATSSGLEAGMRIRRMPHHADTPILALGADDFADTRASCLRAGMNDHIGNLLDTDLLLATVNRWLSTEHALPPDVGKHGD